MKLFDKSLVFWIIVLIVLQIVFSNTLIAHARKVDDLERARRAILEENEILVQKMAELTSLKSIDERAVLLGYKKTNQVIIIDPHTFTVALQSAN